MRRSRGGHKRGGEEVRTLPINRTPGPTAASPRRLERCRRDLLARWQIWSSRSWRGSASLPSQPGDSNPFGNTARQRCGVAGVAYNPLQLRLAEMRLLKIGISRNRWVFPRNEFMLSWWQPPAKYCLPVRVPCPAQGLFVGT